MSKRIGSDIERLWIWITLILIDFESIEMWITIQYPLSFYVGSDSFRYWFQMKMALLWTTLNHLKWKSSEFKLVYMRIWMFDLVNWLVILIINGLVNYNIIRKEKVNFINAHQTKFDNDKILAVWRLQFHLLILVRLESK